VTGLTNGTTYYFRVAAVNAAGTSAFVQSLAVTPKTVADAPTNISGTSRLGVAYLTWNAPLSSGGAAVTRYEITYSTNGGVSWTTWGTVAKNSATLSGLPRGLSYVFKIRAQNAAGWSNFSLPSTTPLLVS
jgi:predicted phage tail protein